MAPALFRYIAASVLLTAAAACATERLSRAPGLEPSHEDAVVAVRAVSATESGAGIAGWLSNEQIESLPSDPAELVEALQTIVGAGVIVRVDGVAGRMPPSTAAIVAVGVRRVELAGGVTVTFVDVITTAR